MRLAIGEARKGRTSPNPRVGALLVRDGELIATGYHLEAGAPHAEVDAIQNASGPLHRRDAVRHARTLQPPRTNGSVYRSDPCSWNSVCRDRVPRPGAACPRGNRTTREGGSERSGGRSRRRVQRPHRRFFEAHTDRASVGDPEGRRNSRRKDRDANRRLQMDHLRTGARRSSSASRGRGRRDGRHRYGARGRSVAHRPSRAGEGPASCRAGRGPSHATHLRGAGPEGILRCADLGVSRGRH